VVETLGSSPAAGAIEKALGIYTWGFFYFFRLVDSNQQLDSLPGDSCGSITRSKTEKFTFMDVTMLYLDSPAVGPDCLVSDD